MLVERLRFEREVLRTGARRIAGIDEAGRGPLAGPVVAAAALFPRSWILEGMPEELRDLNDSKQLTPAARDRYYSLLTASSGFEFGLAVIDAQVIAEVNILRATHRAMREAMQRVAPDHVLVDGLHVASLPGPQTALVKGDARSYLIAAASVMAKVTRDRLMVQYDEQFPQYGFRQHKGYGTRRHLAALAKHGPCPIHRQSFAPIRSQELELWSQ